MQESLFVKHKHFCIVLPFNEISKRFCLIPEQFFVKSDAEYTQTGLLKCRFFLTQGFVAKARVDFIFISLSLLNSLPQNWWQSPALCVLPANQPRSSGTYNQNKYRQPRLFCCRWHLAPPSLLASIGIASTYHRVKTKRESDGVDAIVQTTEEKRGSLLYSCCMFKFSFLMKRRGSTENRNRG